MDYNNSRPPRDFRGDNRGGENRGEHRSEGPRGPRGPYCQSCGMPMLRPEKFGTEASGEKSSEYCCFCYQRGAYTEPNITKEQMFEKIARIMVQRRGMPEEKAQSVASSIIQKLKRWAR